MKTNNFVETKISEKNHNPLRSLNEAYRIQDNPLQYPLMPVLSLLVTFVHELLSHSLFFLLCIEIPVRQSSRLYRIRYTCWCKNSHSLSALSRTLDIISSPILLPLLPSSIRLYRNNTSRTSPTNTFVQCPFLRPLSFSLCVDRVPPCYGLGGPVELPVESRGTPNPLGIASTAGHE